MIGLLAVLVVAIPFILLDNEKFDVEKYRLPCYPDTVEVIDQQILEADTSMVSGAPVVTYRVILCK